MYKSYFEELTQSLKVWDYKLEHLMLACLLLKFYYLVLYYIL